MHMNSCNGLCLQYISEVAADPAVRNLLVDNEGVRVEDDKAHIKRRSAPIDADHIYCDVYLDVTQSYYRTWALGTTVVRVLHAFDDCVVL